MLLWILLALTTKASTYGYGEKMCGEQAKECDTSQLTASGLPFNPSEITAAVNMPKEYRVRPMLVYLKLEGSYQCHAVVVNDKKGRKGLDLTPATLSLLGAKPRRTWSGNVIGCNEHLWRLL